MPQLDPDKPKTTIRTVYVENGNKKEEDSTRREIVQAGIDAWNKALGYEGIKITNSRKTADVRIETGQYLAGQNRTAVDADKNLVLIPKGDEGGWKWDTIAHEVGHTLGLPDTYLEKGGFGSGGEVTLQPGLMGGMSQVPIDAETIQAWTNIARETYGLDLDGEDVHQLLGAVWRKYEDGSEGMEVGKPKDGQPIEDVLKVWAAGMYPQFADQIHNGVPPRVLFSPYVKMAQKELEMEGLHFNDRIVQDGLSQDPAQPVTLSSFKSYLRNLPEWDETAGAERMSSQLIRNINGEAGGVI